MADLMTYAGPAPADGPGTRTGGVPLVPAGFAWPECTECDGAMQFLAQVRLGGDLLSIFMCQNDPGLCDEWDATAGGNRAYLFGADATEPAAVPGEGETLLEEVSAVEVVPVDAPAYPQAAAEWSRRTGRPRSDVLGHLGGEPAWLQFDETPACASCERPMDFVMALEEGHDWHTKINFGGGRGYAFRCAPCRAAAFLWQR
ncbi:hypothetical protein GCM10022255_070810 [Dactylosporangium darangshiense]|uniref:DUF1963 domain-containing protein n=2 Tax=Dactylosporangium darangshiense TaxID=579108 RepID=A0ABP8DI96_9ACTN